MSTGSVGRPRLERGELPDGRLWFTMGRVTGRTLVAYIRDTRRGKPRAWSFRRLLRAFVSVCRTVQYAHTRGVVHRDLEPQNLMVDRFISTRWTDDACGTRVGQVTGTPAYMAPEQASGHGLSANERTDVYALGAVLHHILTGRPPFLGPIVRVLEAVRQGPPPALPEGTPLDLAAIALRAMATRPGDRWCARFDRSRSISIDFGVTRRLPVEWCRAVVG